MPTCQVQVYSISKSHKMAASAIISNVLALEFAHGLLLVLVASWKPQTLEGSTQAPRKQSSNVRQKRTLESS